MKKEILILLCFLCYSVAGFGYSFSAQCETGQNLYYNILGGDSVEVTYSGGIPSYNASNSIVGTVIIPSSVNYNGTTYRVTQIGSNAFRNCSKLLSLTIPESIKNIKGYAFDNTAWLNNQPDGPFYINNSLYKYCGTLPLESVISIKEGTTQICSFAFRSQKGLKEVKIPQSVKIIDASAFSGCNNLVSAVIPDSVVSVGIRVFLGCSSLKSITVGLSVVNMGYQTFWGCDSLTEVIWNAKDCMNGKPLAGLFYEINVYDEATLKWSIDTEYNQIKTFIFGEQVKAIPAGLCFGLTGVSRIIIPDNVEVVGDTAFRWCRPKVVSVGKSLKKGVPPNPSDTLIWNVPDWKLSGHQFTSNILLFGDSVKHVPGRFYSGQMKNIVLPDHLISIDYQAFFNCKMESIVIPNSVTEIRLGAFANCRSLKSVTLSDNITAISNELFLYCDSLQQITIPNSVTKIGSDAFGQCLNLEQVVLGALVDTIDSRAFGSCRQLKSIVCLPQVPPILTTKENALPNGSTTTVYVPCGTYSAYKQAWYWSKTYNAGLDGWITVSDKKVYLEKFPYQLVVSSQNLEEGDVIVNTEPTCTDNAVITAIPKEGYSFVRWNDGDATNPRSIALTSDTTLVAKFGVACNIQAVSQGDKGTVLGAGKYGYGAVVTLESVPNEGYHFVQWNDNNTENPRSIVVLQDSTFTAEFAIDTFTVSVESNDNVLGNVTGAGVYDYNSLITISAIANNHYHFSRWSDGNTENPRNILVTRDSSFVAIFEIDSCLLQLSSNNTQMGYVNGSGTYSYNSLLELTAVPKIGHHFVQWNDGSVTNPRTITLTQDSMFIALFAVDTFMIAVESSDIEMGIVNGSGKYVYYNSVQIEAIPNEGFEFVKWNDNVTLNPRMVLVTQDSLFTAEFQKAQTPIQLVSVLDGVFVSEGQIIIEGYEDEMIYIYNSVGQCISITRNDTTSVLRIRVPYSGVYIVKIANKVLKVII